MKAIPITVTKADGTTQTVYGFDSVTAAVPGGGGSGSIVNFESSRTSGSEIGTLTINGTEYKLYSETPYARATIEGWIDTKLTGIEPMADEILEVL